MSRKPGPCPPLARLHEVLRRDGDRLIWRSRAERDAIDIRWNRNFADHVAGAGGRIEIDGQKFLTRRVIYKMVTGQDAPAGMTAPPAEVQTGIEPGDIWAIGPHRLMCGDAADPVAVAKVMNGRSAALCFTSPPYADQQRDWDTLMAGVFAHLPMTADGQVLVNLGVIHRDNEVWGYADGWIAWMRAHGWRHFSAYVWDQGWGLPGHWVGRFAPAHEMIHHFNKSPRGPNHSIRPTQLTGQPVNASMVRKLSPFRYPGGKTWFVPHLRRWLAHQPACSVFVEPFCGGGIVGLTVAAECLAKKVVLCESNPDVAAVWKCCLSRKDSEALAQRIMEFRLDIDTVKQVLDSTPRSTLDRAFRTIVFNRVSRGGVIARGAGILKKGENNKGLGSRWYPDTLANRIRFISTLTPIIDFFEDDAFDVIARYQDQPDAAFFSDPPYTAGTGKRAGKRLYEHNSIDHTRLFRTMRAVQGSVVMTYDDDPDVIQLAEHHDLHVSRVSMRNTHHREVQELVITKVAWPVALASRSERAHKIPDSVIRIARDTAAHQHPARFPVALGAYMIEAFTDSADVVYEPFAGSGTMIVAAQQTGRACYAIELNPNFCKIALQRIAQETGLSPVKLNTRPAPAIVRGRS